MLWRGIMGFTKFGDKFGKIHAGGSACSSPSVRLDHHSLRVVFVCNALFLFLLLYFHIYKPKQTLLMSARS